MVLLALETYMGLWYHNVTVKGPTQRELATFLNARGASVVISPTVNGVTVIYDMERGAGVLSAHFRSPVLSLGIHDDDILGYRLYVAGVEHDSYESCPGYFTDQNLPPRGGDAGKLCVAFGVEEALARVDAILRDPHIGMAAEQHQELADALGWPRFAAGISALMIMENPEILPGYGLEALAVTKTGDYRDQ